MNFKKSFWNYFTWLIFKLPFTSMCLSAAQVSSSWHAGNARSERCFLHFRFTFVLSAPFWEFPWATLPQRFHLTWMFVWFQLDASKWQRKEDCSQTKTVPPLPSRSVRPLISETCLSFPCHFISVGDGPSGGVHAVRWEIYSGAVKPCTLVTFIHVICPSILPGLIYDWNCLQFPEWP